MCTASILNLCAISLDRYVAVTHPVTYPNLMSMKKAKILVCLVWVLSFVICLPPLIGWKSEKADPLPQLPPLNETAIAPCQWICELTSDTGYVVYSALGSFYIPMLVMLFFYWRIYRAAVRTTRAINQGFRTTKTMRNRFEESRMTLRIHRGRGSSVRNHSAASANCAGANCASACARSECARSECARSDCARSDWARDCVPGNCAFGAAARNGETAPFLHSPEVSRFRRCSVRRAERGHEKVKISVSYPSTDGLNSLLGASNGTALDINRSGSFSSSSPSNSGNLYVQYACADNNGYTAPSSHLLSLIHI